MSHYPVLVVGSDIEAQLAPFSESLEVAPYDAGPCFCTEDGGGSPDPACEDCHGTGRDISTSNPAGKWDWYQVGGRYAGRLLIRCEGQPDRWGDSCLKGQFHVEGALAKRRHDAEITWELLLPTLTEYLAYPEHLRNMRRREFFDAFGPDHGLWPPDVQRMVGLETDLVFDFGLNPHVDALEHERFVTDTAYRYVAGRAVVINQTWRERGRMEMFGATFDDKPPKEWFREWTELLVGVPNSETITVVDCHT